MAYKKKDIYDAAVKAIDNNNLFYFSDIIAWIPCDKTTFYRFFKPESNQYNALKEQLDRNKVVTKSAIRKKLFKSNRSGELLALYRLICTPEERQLLNQQYLEITGKGGKDLFKSKSDSELDSEINELQKKINSSE